MGPMLSCPCVSPGCCARHRRKPRRSCHAFVRNLAGRRDFLRRQAQRRPSRPSRNRPGPGARGQGRLHPARRGPAAEPRSPLSEFSSRSEINAGGGVGRSAAPGNPRSPATRRTRSTWASQAQRLIDQGVVALIGVLEPRGILRAPGHREGQTPFLLLAAVADNPAEGGLNVPDAAQRQRHGHAHRKQNGRDGEVHQSAHQARGHHARGRQLRHDHGQSRRGVREDVRLRTGAARAL